MIELLRLIIIVTNTRKYHLSCVLWDNRVWNTSANEEVIGEMHREELKWENDILIQIYLNNAKTEFSKHLNFK